MGSVYKLLWQAIVDTIANGLLSLVWEFLARMTTTFLLYGVFETVSRITKVPDWLVEDLYLQVSQITSQTSLLSVWTFLSSPELKELMLVRIVMATFFVSTQYPLITAAGPLVTDLLGGEMGGL